MYRIYNSDDAEGAVVESAPAWEAGGIECPPTGTITVVRRDGVGWPGRYPVRPSAADLSLYERFLRPVKLIEDLVNEVRDSPG